MSSRRDGLALWIAGPLLGLVIVFGAMAALPRPICEGSEAPGFAGARTVLVCVTAAIALLCVAAAAQRLRGLERAGRWVWPRELLVLCGGVWVLLVGIFAISWGDTRGVWPLVLIPFLTGAFVTVVLFLSLVFALLVGRRVDQVGLLVPAYVLGAGLIVFPLMAGAALTLRGLAC